jgi:hypothetical protein
MCWPEFYRIVPDEYTGLLNSILQVSFQMLSLIRICSMAGLVLLVLIIIGSISTF